MRGNGKRQTDRLVRKMRNSFSGPFEPKAYVLDMPVMYDDDFVRKWNTMKIRPLDISRDELVSAYSGTREFAYTIGGTVLTARYGESEPEFLLRAASDGVYPELRHIEDSDYKTIDFVDMVTGESLMKMREKALKEKGF